MSVAQSFQGTTYNLPENDEVDWGTTVLNYLVAIATTLNRLVGPEGTGSTLLGIPTTSTLAAGATLTPVAFFHKVSGTPGAVTLSAVTAIADPTTGNAILILVGNHAANTVTIQDNANTKLKGGVSAVLALNSILALWFNGTDWVELFRSL